MAVKFGISNVTRVGNDVTFTVFALNADNSIDTAYTGNFTFGYSGFSGVSGYIFTGADQGQRVFTATIVNPVENSNLAALFPGTETGANLFYASATGGAFFGLSGNHYVVGGSGDNTFVTQSGNDFIFGGAGNDLMNGGAGNDILDGGTGDDSMSGASGNDIFVVDALGDTVTEQPNEGIDLVRTTLSLYTLGANVENLTYDGSSSFTGRGNDDANVITGGAFGDTLKGRGGNDTLNGGGSNDDLNGGAGADTMNGGEGNDTLRVDNIGDIVNGGNGTDTVSITAAITYNASGYGDVEWFENLSGGNVTAIMNALDNLYAGGVGMDIVQGGGGVDTIYGYGGMDFLDGQAGNDRLFGGIGNDALNGGDDSDVLEGGDDIDTLIGGNGDDTLYGQDGSDTLNGGTGFDTLVGGIWQDSFAFATGDSGSTLATADRIVDFSTAQGDKIDLTAIDAVTGGGDNVFSFIGTAAFSNVAGQLRTEVIFGNTYAMGDTNGDGVADFFIKLDGSVPLSGTDFLL